MSFKNSPSKTSWNSICHFKASRKCTLWSTLSLVVSIGMVLSEDLILFRQCCYVTCLLVDPFILSVSGSVDVPVDSLEMGVEVEKWYPVTMESNKTNGGEASSIRLRFKYQVYFFLWSVLKLLFCFNHSLATVTYAMLPCNWCTRSSCLSLYRKSPSFQSRVMLNCQRYYIFSFFFVSWS